MIWKTFAISKFCGRKLGSSIKYWRVHKKSYFLAFNKKVESRLKKCGGADALKINEGNLPNRKKVLRLKKSFLSLFLLPVEHRFCNRVEVPRPHPGPRPHSKNSLEIQQLFYSSINLSVKFCWNECALFIWTERGIEKEPTGIYVCFSLGEMI